MYCNTQNGIDKLNTNPSFHSFFGLKSERNFQTSTKSVDRQEKWKKRRN
jgi:hypothetical protein